jgi:hypothetical protein
MLKSLTFITEVSTRDKREEWKNATEGKIILTRQKAQRNRTDQRGSLHGSDKSHSEKSKTIEGIRGILMHRGRRMPSQGKQFGMFSIAYSAD